MKSLVGNRISLLSISISAYFLFFFSLIVFSTELNPFISNSKLITVIWTLLGILFLVCCFISFFIAIRTAKKFRQIQFKEKMIGFSPMMFCLLTLYVLLQWSNKQVLLLSANLAESEILNNSLAVIVNVFF